MQQSIVKFIALSYRHCSTCFGHHNAHHQEPVKLSSQPLVSVWMWRWKCSQPWSVWEHFHLHIHTETRGCDGSLTGTWWWALWCPKHVEQYLYYKAINFTIDYCIWLVVLFELRSCNLALIDDIFKCYSYNGFSTWCFGFLGSRNQPYFYIIRMTEGLMCLENYDNIFTNPL
jgi:hypothetical protein